MQPRDSHLTRQRFMAMMHLWIALVNSMILIQCCLSTKGPSLEETCFRWNASQHKKSCRIHILEVTLTLNTKLYGGLVWPSGFAAFSGMHLFRDLPKDSRWCLEQMYCAFLESIIQALSSVVPDAYNCAEGPRQSEQCDREWPHSTRHVFVQSMNISIRSQ